MKIKYKILTSLLAPITAIPLCLTSVSCSKGRYAKIAEKLFNTTLEEFYKICKIYRKTYYTADIAAHINDRVYEMEQVCYDDWDKVRKESTEPHTSGNLLVKIPATEGWEEKPAIIIQGHMDMVCDGFPSEGAGSVSPVIEGDIMHTRDYKTSLGADDGIGIAAMLAIIKHKDEFNHGPINCIFTADEEDGNGCAMYVQDSWIEDAKYIINVDHENIDDIGISCAGVQEVAVKIPLNKTTIETISTETESDFNHQYTLKVWGAQGGASGFALENNPVFPILLGFQMLDEMFPKDEGDHYTITNIKTDQGQSNGGAGISTDIEITIATDITDQTSLNKKFADAKAVVIKNRARHPSEINLKTSILPSSTQEKQTVCLTLPQSRALKDLFTRTDLYGDVSPTGSPTIIACSNVGPISLTPTDNAIDLDFHFFGRSSNEEILGPKPADDWTPETTTSQKSMMYTYYSIIKKELFDSGDVSRPAGTSWYKSYGWNPCWQEGQSLFTDLYKDYAKNHGGAIGEFRALGWCETAEFVNKRKILQNPIQASCIGPTIVNGHNKEGYLVVSSVKTMLERMIYGIENLK